MHFLDLAFLFFPIHGFETRVVDEKSDGPTEEMDDTVERAINPQYPTRCRQKLVLCGIEPQTSALLAPRSTN